MKRAIPITRTQGHDYLGEFPARQKACQAGHMAIEK